MAWKFSVLAVWHGEESFLVESQQARGNREDEAQQSEEDVNRHVKDSQRFPDHREEIRHESGHILEGEDCDGEDADPRMQRVQVGDLGIRVVVRVESGDESVGGEEECESVDGRVSDFKTLLASVAEATVDENS